jgi:hypothetical protein
LNSVLSMVLPRSFGYGTHGMGLVLATGVYAVMAVLSLSIPMLLLRARLGPRRDREGLIDASAIAAAVGIVLWDALVLSAPGADLTSVTMLAALALAVAVSTTFALVIRLVFTGIMHLRAAQLMLASGVGAIAATVVLSVAGGSIVVGAVWPAELLKLIALGLAAGAALHPSALRIGQRAAPTELGAGISQGRLVVLAGVLLVPACATVVRSWWLAGHLGGPMVDGPPPPALLPSSLAALVVTAAVIWRMWQLLQDREKARQSLRHHATHDDLTGLPNRRALYELLHARGGRDRRRQRAGRPVRIAVPRSRRVQGDQRHAGPRGG